MGKLTNIAKKNKAKTKIRVGKARLRASDSDAPGVLGKKTNKVRLMLARDGAKNLIEGTRELNALNRQSTDSNNQ